jgi:hypothetical protein
LFEGVGKMELTRKIAIMIVFSVLAIIGSGLFWVLSEDWGVVFTFLSILGFALLAFLFNPEQIISEMVDEEKSKG